VSQAVYGIGKGALLAVDPGVLAVKFVDRVKYAVAVAVNAAETHLYVADAGNQAVFVAPIGSNALTQIDTGVPTPSLVDIKVDGAGDLYVLNQSPAELIKVPADGTAPFVLDINGMETPSSFTIDPNGTIYIADLATRFHDSFLLQVTPSGIVNRVYGSDGGIGSVASDTTGVVWLTENALVKIIPGTWTSTGVEVGHTFSGVSTDAANSVYWCILDGGVVIGPTRGFPSHYPSDSDYPYQGETVYTATSPSGKLYTIENGEVKMYDRTSGQGEKVAYYSPGATLWNIGNMNLISTNPDKLYTESGNGVGLFKFGPDETAGCAAGIVLSPGTLCNLVVDYKPKMPGIFTDTLHFLTNAVNANDVVWKVTGGVPRSR